MNYYNEIDPQAAQWLRNLISAGHIAPGDVDERSIEDVKPNELRGYTQHHFFAGIGGWPLALDIAGWPRDRPVFTGSCPCQSFSVAGKCAGFADQRHLWPAWFHIIRELAPSVVFGEQVAAAIRHGWLDLVSADLEGAGYAIGSAVLGAHSVGAPHIRQRLYWVADSGASDSILRGLGGRNLRGLGAGGQQVQEPQDGARIADESCDGHADAVRLSDAEHTIGRAEHAQHGYAHRRDGLGRDCISGGAPDMQRQRLEGHAGNVADGHEPGRIRAQPFGHAAESVGVGVPWSGYRVHRYLDGKDRRIPTEPRLFPLADDRHPLHRGRVGLLRGAGNAIVPALAAEFVMAWMEVRE